MGSADFLSDAKIFVSSIVNMAKQGAIASSSGMDWVARFEKEFGQMQDLRIGSRQIIDCEWTATPLDQITACLGAGCLVMVMLGSAGANKATWKAVEVTSWDGKTLKAKQLYDNVEFVVTNPTKAITRIVYWSKGGA